MIVADVVKILEDEAVLGRMWWNTHERVMRTYEIITELKKVDQELQVLEFKTNKGGLMPELYIHVEGRKNEESRAG